MKNGLVLNLVIEEGYVHALVSGTKSTPYEVIVSIKPMSESKIDRLTKLCNNQISNLEELIEGKFPKSLKDMFNQSENGLFPTSKEIGFDCDCPDGAYMCKHVSAVLYAIGAKFDTDPTLFFKLRGIDFNILLAKSAEDKMNTMLSNTNKKSDKIIEDDDISELFNI